MNRDTFFEKIHKYFPIGLSIYSGLVNGATFLIAYLQNIVWLMISTTLITAGFIGLIILYTKKKTISSRETEITILHCKDELIITDEDGKNAKLIKTVTLYFNDDTQSFLYPLMTGPGKLTDFKVYQKTNPNLIYNTHIAIFGAQRSLYISFDSKIKQKTIREIIIEMNIEDGFLESQVGYSLDSYPKQQSSYLKVRSAKKICNQVLWYVFFGKNTSPRKTGTEPVFIEEENGKKISCFDIDFSPYISQLGELTFSTNWFHEK